MHEHPGDRAAILIIDSDAISLTATAEVLGSAGHRTHCAQTFNAALKALRATPIDLIVCEVSLQGESGLQWCRDLQEATGTSDVPQMFISGQQSPDIIRRVHDAGGTYYLRRPYDPRVLVELVDTAIWMPHVIRQRSRRWTTLTSVPEPHGVSRRVVSRQAETAQ